MRKSSYERTGNIGQYIVLKRKRSLSVVTHAQRRKCSHVKRKRRKTRYGSDQLYFKRKRKRSLLTVILFSNLAAGCRVSRKRKKIGY